MKAILIDPQERTLEEVSIDGTDDIARLIGYDTVISDEIGPGGDRLHLDEECFIRGATGRFRIDNVAPVAGRGVITGSIGAGQVLADAQSTADDIEQRLTWLE